MNTNQSRYSLSVRCILAYVLLFLVSCAPSSKPTTKTAPVTSPTPITAGAGGVTVPVAVVKAINVMNCSSLHNLIVECHFELEETGETPTEYEVERRALGKAWIPLPKVDAADSFFVDEDFKTFNFTGKVYYRIRSVGSDEKKSAYLTSYIGDEQIRPSTSATVSPVVGSLPNPTPTPTPAAVTNPVQTVSSTPPPSPVSSPQNFQPVFSPTPTPIGNQYALPAAPKLNTPVFSKYNSPLNPTVDLTWSQDYSGGGIPTGIIVESKQANGSWTIWPKSTALNEPQIFSFSSLNDGMLISFRARFFNSAGESLHSEITNIQLPTMGGGKLPTAPTYVDARASSDHEIFLIFHEFAFDCTEFVVEASSDNINFLPIHTERRNSDGNPYINVWLRYNLTPSTDYYIRVRSKNSTGLSLLNGIVSHTKTLPKGMSY